MIKNKTIVSECVTNGHPDKIADCIADCILDEFTCKDENVRAGIEVMVKDNIVVLGGEIHSNNTINYDEVVRNVYRGLDFPADHGLSPDNIKIINLIGKQSAEIHNAVDNGETIGAGDQGFVCGFSTNETPAMLGLGHYIAKKICVYIEESEHLGPDGKSQVIIEYGNDGDAKIKSILVSSMHHSRCFNLNDMRDTIKEAITTNAIGLDTEIYEKYITGGEWQLNINPSGEWHMGGPISDCGVTGRKIVVDQFGGYSKVGGGALSGKEFTKVDRSGAYMARYIANNIVASGITDSAKVELSYMIGIAEPSSVYVCMDKNKHLEGEVTDIIKRNIDLTPSGIIKRFGNIGVRYGYIGEFGHYGVPKVYNWDKGSMDWIYNLYPWEKTDNIAIFDKLKNETKC